MDIDYVWLLLPFLIAWFAWHLYRLHDEVWRLRKAERQAVREWHPKCETCGHTRLGITSLGGLDCGMSRSSRWDGTVEPDFYCAEHTALRGEEQP